MAPCPPYGAKMAPFSRHMAPYGAKMAPYGACSYLTLLPKMFIRDAALLPVVQFQKDGYLGNQHNVLYQIIDYRWKSLTLPF